MSTTGVRLCQLSRVIRKASCRYVSYNIGNVENELSALLPADRLSNKSGILDQYSKDESHWSATRPNLVVFPENAGEVAEVLKTCNNNKVPVTAFGTGTGLEGGTTATQGGVTLAMCNMSKIVSLNPEDFDVTVQPGVTRIGLNNELRSSGLWFPIDPGADASLCGMVATSASGTNAVRYGTMRDNVLNLQVVLADGTIIHTQGRGNRARKTSAGYNLTNLFCGSEGTLGIITEATLRLHGMPEASVAAVCTFPSLKNAVSASTAVIQCGLPVARMELLDPASIRACNAFSNLSLSESYTIFFEFAGSEKGIESQAEAARDIAQEFGGGEFQFAKETEKRNELWEARHTAYWAILATKPGWKAIITDICVPISKMTECILRCDEVIHEHGFESNIVGHVGDGNFHTVLMCDPSKAGDKERARRVSEELGRISISLNGTCTGEHGIGLGKKTLLEREVGKETLDVMKTLKRTLDPNNILNPGKVLDP